MTKYNVGRKRKDLKVQSALKLQDADIYIYIYEAHACSLARDRYPIFFLQFIIPIFFIRLLLCKCQISYKS